MASLCKICNIYTLYEIIPVYKKKVEAIVYYCTESFHKTGL